MTLNGRKREKIKKNSHLSLLLVLGGLDLVRIDRTSYSKKSPAKFGAIELQCEGHGGPLLEEDVAEALSDIDLLVPDQPHVGNLAAVLEKGPDLLLGGLEVHIANEDAPLVVSLDLLAHPVNTNVLALKLTAVLSQGLFN